MHSPDATWETGLVIPETSKPIDVQTLDALLRIEVLLEQLLGERNEVAIEGDIADRVTNLSPTKTPFLEAGAGALLSSTSPEDPKPPKGKRTRGQ
jgi:hypothetical protein